MYFLRNFEKNIQYIKEIGAEQHLCVNCSVLSILDNESTFPQVPNEPFHVTGKLNLYMCVNMLQNYTNCYFLKSAMVLCTDCKVAMEQIDTKLK